MNGNRKDRAILVGNAVTKHFDGVQALTALDFDLWEGEILGLIGPNGSGKTTLFNVVSGILQPTSGDVLLEDVSVVGMSPHSIAQRGLQRTFQNLRLFERLSVLTNVAIGAHLRARAGLHLTLVRSASFRRLEERTKKEARDWLAFVGLDQDYQEIAQSLPYGKQKLLEIARALAARPRLLLLDEPAAGLNATEVHALARVIDDIREIGVTVFVVEHNMRLIMDICDRIIVINFGQKVAEGTPGEVQKNRAVQEAYLGT
jgi:branched-chain amino acid transport system ATP-binding protein